MDFSGAKVMVFHVFSGAPDTSSGVKAIGPDDFRADHPEGSETQPKYVQIEELRCHISTFALLVGGGSCSGY